MTLSRGLLIGLVTSAAVNVFLIGGVAGVLLARRDAPVQVPAPVPAAVYSPAPVEPEPAVQGPVATPAAPAAKPSTPPAAAAPAEGGRAPMWTAGQGLSPESRKALRLALREANQRNQPITRQARAERQAALAALKTKTYDPAEVARRFAAARALDIQARGNVETAVANYAAGLSPEERLALADGLVRVYGPRAQPKPQR